MSNNLFPSDEEVADELAEVRRALMKRIHRQRWRLPAVVGVAGLVLGASAAGISAVVVARAASDIVQHSVRCFESDSLTARYMDFGTSAATNNTSGDVTAQGAADPQTLCSLAWRGGLLGQAQVPIDPNSSNFAVPPLAACRLNSGQRAAFPAPAGEAASEVCKTLGLPAL